MSTSGTSGPTAPGGRRARVRRETLAELKRAALDEVRASGAVGLALRSVARRMEMSPAGLYRYVDSREALLTLLIADGYHDLGHHLEVALGAPADRDGVDGRPPPAPPTVAPPDADVADRLCAVARTYRVWSVTHPNEFGLLFGDPIPGYEAEVIDRLGAMQQLIGDLPLELGALLLVTWGRLHGQVSLEVFGHHHWLFPDGCAAIFDADLEAMLADLGVLRGVRPPCSSP